MGQFIETSRRSSMAEVERRHNRHCAFDPSLWNAADHDWPTRRAPFVTAIQPWQPEA